MAAQVDASNMSFTPVPLTTLEFATSLPVDMYLRPSEDAPPVLYRERRLEFPPGEIAKLMQRGVSRIYVPADQFDDYQRYLRDHVATVIADPSVPLAQRTLFLSETGRGMLGEVFKSGSTDKTMETAAEISGHMTSLLSQNQLLAGDLLDVLRHDYHTFTHAYNVANYAVLLAKGLGIRDADQLQAISVGGLVHDQGKLRIPNAILTKKGRLSEEEWRTIQRHPVDGFEELSVRLDLSYSQLMMVYQHHEKLDGSGYPVGAVGKEINSWARICTVVDIFEALTSRRPYRTPLSAAKTIAILEKEAGAKLDAEFVKCWKSQIKRTKIGGSK